jgi:hypothetical protein
MSCIQESNKQLAQTRGCSLHVLARFSRTFWTGSRAFCKCIFSYLSIKQKFGAQTSFKLKEMTTIVLIGEQVFGFYK